ncbi:MAG: Cell division protein FtsA [Alphaproteobacteria bacterium MarineAlpha6_Bin4]|nr:MAG: Cell division protein FtsA [Alphaproteobacteria bacterium MarineAlpha6_Bin4]|tara:strand:- start:206 stop:1426 length:1221 start_codon:yes stop_codon:yes gene_type:complete
MRIGILDIGTDKISCFIVNISKDKEPEILGIGLHQSSGVSSGIITDMELACNSIRASIQSAEKMFGSTVEEFVVNFSSSTIQSQIINLNTSLDNNEVTNEDIRNNYKQIDSLNYGENRQLLHKIRTSYSIDRNINVEKPIGMKGKELVAGFNLITADNNSINNFIKCLSLSKIRVSDIVITPYASGLGCLNKDDLYIGTTVIDIGAGCTSIATFYKNKLVYANIINIGGFNISSDIARGLSTSISTAERLKILHGSSVNVDEENDLIDVPLTGNNETTETHKVYKKELNNIILSRIQEILESIRSKTSKLVLERNITSNIVLTGKSSELKGFKNLTSDFFGMKVRIGKPTKIKGLAENTSGPGFSVCCGLIKYKILKEDGYFYKNNLIENSVLWRKFGSWIKESFF